MDKNNLVAKICNQNDGAFKLILLDGRPGKYIRVEITGSKRGNFHSISVTVMERNIVLVFIKPERSLNMLPDSIDIKDLKKVLSYVTSTTGSKFYYRILYQDTRIRFTV